MHRYGKSSSRKAMVLLTVMLTGCGAPGILPYEPRTPPDIGDRLYYGFSGKQVDARHYEVIYSDNRPDQAQTFLELRAAQIAQGAGFAYFAFDKRGLNTYRKTDSELEPVGALPHDSVRNTPPQFLGDTIPDIHTYRVTDYYYAWGDISLLTPAQAQGNTKAMQVSEVLARLGSNLRP